MSSSTPFRLSLPVTPTDHVHGPHSAPLTVVEYGDFECPNCEQAHGVVRLLITQYGAHLRFVYRHFPLRDVHPHAEGAAEAAEAAGAQGRFWQMEALLFKNRQHLKPHALREYAASLELDLLRFDAELADHIYLQRIQEHIASAHASGVRQTPTFFLNGALVDVSFGIERLPAALAEEAKRLGLAH